MFTPLGIKTDYSLLKSLIKIKDLVLYAKEHNISSLGILDDNLLGSYEFFIECNKNNIKPIIGYHLNKSNYNLYLYATNSLGLHNLFRLNKCDNIDDNVLNKYKDNIICVIPFIDKEKENIYNKIYDKVFISYSNKDEYNKLLNIDNKVYIKITLALKESDSLYINYLKLIEENQKLGGIKLIDYTNNSLKIEEYDTNILTDLITYYFDDICIHTPKYEDVLNQKKYLNDLALKGLYKRKNGNVSKYYIDRLQYELDIIDQMGFVDYFLIVLDYVRYAIKNGIYVGPGRGSAVGSLVAYSLGITWIDPIEYNLLFERFLNPQRVTMPDIDIDFEDERRDEVVKYVKNKYGENRVSKIITFATFTAKEVLRSVGKINNVDDYVLNNLLRLIDSKKSLNANLDDKVKSVLNKYKILHKVYEESMHLEGIKKHIGIHAAGVVICDTELTDVVPVIKYGDEYLCGYTKEQLEPLGLLKMDFLSVRNLTLIANVLRDIKDKTGIDLDINKVDLTKNKVYDLFKNGNTLGIFQFEAIGMRRFLIKLKPNNFSDLFMAIAIYRPGAIDEIPIYLERKNNHKQIDYIDESLKPILESTYGVLIYQEQIMEILKVMGNFSYSEADIIRRAISKKKIKDIDNYRTTFITNAISNNYHEDVAEKVFNLITKFASFGFNKSHSVAYAFFAYQMAYLKTYYFKYFITNMLNMYIGVEDKTKEIIDEIKSNGLKIKQPDINLSSYKYIEEDDGIRMPLRAIKGLGNQIVDSIISKRDTLYKDFYDFIARIYDTNINKKALSILIEAGVFNSFNINRKTLISNLDAFLLYAELVSNLDISLVNKPVIKEYIEYSDIELMELEKKLYGFYVSTHPSNKYPHCFKLYKIKSNFNKIVESVVLIENITKIRTKNNQDMAFVDVSDETSTVTLVVFRELFSKVDNEISKGNLVKIKGRIERRQDKYQIILLNVEKI